MENAEYVVCHAGSGLISAALRAGRRPLVLPRLARHGEHFDDHQTQIVAKLERLGLVVAISDRITAEHLAAARLPLPEQAEQTEPTVEVALRAELELLLGRPSGEPDQTVAPNLVSAERRIA